LTLDADLTNRAAPPGSTRYFSLLYTPPGKREVLMALYVIDAEIREGALGANHDVAHTRLMWWRQEIDRLVNSNPQHPASRALLERGHGDRKRFARLHELIAAADMDLARMTYATPSELDAYCSRSGGTITTLAAHELLDSTPDDPTSAAANHIGSGMRLTEIVRDVRQDAHDGRLYVPLDILDRDSASIDDVRNRDITAKGKAAVASLAQHAAGVLGTSMATMPTLYRAPLVPLFVLGALHERLLKRIAKHQYEVGVERIELGAVEKPFTAWRGARRAMK
jgi:phytoene synthase